MTESGNITSSPLTKLKASFVSPGLAGRAHFANSMSGFGKVIRKKAKTAATHFPVETATSSQTETATSSKIETVIIDDKATDSFSVPLADDKILESDSSASVQTSSIKGGSTDLPNPFKITCTSNEMAGVGDEDSDAELGDNNTSNLLGLEEAPSRGTALELKENGLLESELTGSVPFFETSPQSEGNALSLLSGAYDESSSENESDS